MLSIFGSELGNRVGDMRVAVLGLGTMGGAFAVNLDKAGFAVSGYNRSAIPSPRDREYRFTVSSDVPTSVTGASVILVILTDAAATSGVLLQPSVLEAIEPDAVLVNMGTIGVEQTAALARGIAATRPDILFVDAPVSGSRAPAESGAVTILASSDADTPSNENESSAHPLRDRLSPVFDTIGRRTIWLGSTGAGSAMKVVVNTWLVHVMQGIAETALLADRLGISPDDLSQTLGGGPLDTPYAAAKLRKIGAGDWSTEMALSLGAKDARLAVSAGEGLDLPITALIAETWTTAAGADSPLADLDISAIYRALAPQPSGALEE